MELSLTENKQFLRIDDATELELEQLNITFNRRIDNWRFHPLVKKGLWDGYISYMKDDKWIPSGLWKEVMDMAKTYKYELKTNFYKANSGYIFEPNKGLINIKSKISKNKNPYIQSQIKAHKEVKKFRKKGVNCSSIFFLQVESPLRNNDFFIKKICTHAKLKKNITVGNLNTIRDYSWAPEIVEGIYHLTKIKPRDLMLSSGQGISGYEILKTAYEQNKLDYRKYFSINKIALGFSHNIFQ